MTKNEGSLDRIIRVLIGVAALLLVFTGTVSGAWAWVAGIVGGISLFTAATGFCGLYKVLGFQTCPVKQPKA